MISTTPATRALVAELTAALDEEIALLDLRRRQLSAMAGAILDRDDEAMGDLLEEMESTQELQARTDDRLRRLRRPMADALACKASEAKLPVLIDRLPAGEQGALETRRRRIVELAEAVRREHVRTTVLLAECVRINRALLEGLFPQSESVRTYGAGGPLCWRSETGLVDTES
jgi:flagellar biosynthesis/type III secretory pathway chaperone